MTEESCRLLHGYWGGADARCDWYDCRTHALLGMCCTTWGACVDRVSEQRCMELAGTWRGQPYCCTYRHPDCHVIFCPTEPEDEPGCYEARTDADSGSQPNWTDDLCATAAFVPGRLDTDAPPYFRLVSTWPVRAVGVPVGEEPCRHQIADMRLDAYGYAEPVMCNDLYPEHPGMEARVSPLYMTVGDGHSQLAGGYHTPYWTEAVLRSSRLVCSPRVD